MTRIAIAAVLGLAACANVTPAQQATLTATAVGAATTLGAVAAANNRTAAQIIANGQLVCALLQGGYVAPLGANVTGATKQAMDAVCSALGGVGVALPAGVNPATVQAVAVAIKAP